MTTIYPHENNNFDCLRLLAACVVFTYHAFTIYGVRDYSVLYSDIYIPISAGTVGVSIFFTISGYLITQSCTASKSPGSFLKKRILRLYPALIANCLIVTYLIVPITTSLPLEQYYHMTLHHFFTIFISDMLLIEPRLPGAFAHNVIAYAVNSSLWTLYYEVFCYYFVFVAFILPARIILPIFFAFLTVFYFNEIFYSTDMHHLGFLHCEAFLLGSMLFLFKDHIPYNRYVAAIMALLLLALIATNTYFLPLYLISVCYLTIYIALHIPYFGNAVKFGDLSYGIYIYAWPVQQTFAAILMPKSASFTEYFLLSAAVTLCCAMFSWHVIERQALRFK